MCCWLLLLLSNKPDLPFVIASRYQSIYFPFSFLIAFIIPVVYEIITFFFVIRIFTLSGYFDNLPVHVITKNVRLSVYQTQLGGYLGTLSGTCDYWECKIISVSNTIYKNDRPISLEI